ncbi:MAG: cyclic lactone autoinducer peptide [Lachnospiraceae bacterium]|jgi:cyclic lactone autoinducer peptide|nr:cyclic lactone autoinducer peptide [Lachnospiraceae bacterium]
MIAQSILNKVAKAALGFANFGANSASIFNRYQPKLPDSLKKKK